MALRVIPSIRRENWPSRQRVQGRGLERLTRYVQKRLQLFSIRAAKNGRPSRILKTMCERHGKSDSEEN